MESDIMVLLEESRHSPIKNYIANENMPIEKAYDFLNLNKKNYIILPNGKNSSDGNIEKGDNVLVFYKL